MRYTANHESYEKQSERRRLRYKIGNKAQKNDEKTLELNKLNDYPDKCTEHVHFQRCSSP